MDEQDGGFIPDSAFTDAGTGTDVVAAPQGFGERLLGGFVSILIGIVLVPLACAGLWWNEGHAVHVARALAETRALVQTVPTDRRDPARDGKPVHVAGPTASAAGVTDPQLGIHAAGLQLVRRVEMFQWRESQSGSGNDRKYTYRQEWADIPVSSDSFHFPSGHQNPVFPSVRSGSFGASDARIDAFPVGAAAVLLLPVYTDLPADEAGAAAITRGFGRPARAQPGTATYLIGRGGDEARVGDVRISYRHQPNETASFIGRQGPAGLDVYRATNGEEIMLAEPGARSADQMIAKGQDDNRVLAWVFRAVGMVVMLIGFWLLFGPVNTLASFIPILGELVSGATFLVALAATILVGPVVIGLAWLTYRPLVGAGIIGAAALLAYGTSRLRARRRRPAFAAA